MRQGVLMWAALSAAFLLGYRTLGYEAVYILGYGAIAMMAVLIMATYMWLYSLRATPLALGMSFSWSATAAVMFWWWSFAVANQPEGMREHPILFAFLALYMTGAMLHFVVIQRSLRLSRKYLALPVAAVAGAVLLGAILMS